MTKMTKKRERQKGLRTGASSLTLALLLSPIMVCAISTMPAFAVGGTGGGSLGAGGGVGGVDSPTGSGESGGTACCSSFGGGGGGAGETGGAGSVGGSGLGGNGGSGGLSAGDAGQAGTDGTAGTARGGGGGGGGAHGVVIGTLPIAPSTGGAGGHGGVGPINAFGGGGGGGGYGAVVTGSNLSGNINDVIVGGRGGNGGGGHYEFDPTGSGGSGGIGLLFTGNGNQSTIATSITGGAGGDGGSNVPGDGGSGGAGGVGLAGSSLSLILNGTITGGDGGVKGTGNKADGADGLGGVGIVGEGLIITLGNGGRIAGGHSGDGTTRANAITFTGGANRLELQAGSTIIGNIDASAGTSDTFVLGGPTDSSFDVGRIVTAATPGATNEIIGLENFRKTGTSTWTLTGAGAQDWSIDEGTLAGNADSFGGDLTFAGGVGNRGVVFNQFGIGTYAGAISGNGSLIKTGTGTLTLNGVNTYSGLTTVEDGKLVVGGVGNSSGSLAGAVTVLSGGALGGIGTVGATTIEAGGIHAPGNSPGTQTIMGDYANHGTLQIDVTPTLADKLIVNGAVDISGATLDLHLSPMSPADWNILNGPFTIIANDSSDAVIGSFAPVTMNLLFLNESLDYVGGDGNDVTLELTRNNVDFASVGQTRNQKATGGGIGSLALGNPLWNVIALQNDEGATRAAFDQLSGEVHASAKSALIEDSQFIRGAANDRIRSGFSKVGVPAMPVLAYGETRSGHVATAAIGGLLATADTQRFAAWGRAFGSWGRTDSNGNAAELNRSTGGFLTGIDGSITSDWRLGVLAGYSHSTFDVDDRTSSGSSDNYHLGLYGGSQWGNLGLRGGTAYSVHDIETNRSVIFPGFTDTLKGDYDAGTFQAFGELGYRIDTSSSSFEPFVNLAYINLYTDRFTETGGTAALTSANQSTDTTLTTFGVRASTSFTLGTITATAGGTLGWRHAFGDTTPLTTQAFAGGSTFTVAGIPIAKDAAIVEAGLDLDLTDTVALGIAYQGQLGSGAQQNGLNAKLALKF